MAKRTDAEKLFKRKKWDKDSVEKKQRELEKRKAKLDKKLVALANIGAAMGIVEEPDEDTDIDIAPAMTAQPSVADKVKAAPAAEPMVLGTALAAESEAASSASPERVEAALVAQEEDDTAAGFWPMVGLAALLVLGGFWLIRDVAKGTDEVEAPAQEAVGSVEGSANAVTGADAGHASATVAGAAEAESAEQNSSAVAVESASTESTSAVDSSTNRSTETLVVKETKVSETANTVTRLDQSVASKVDNAAQKAADAAASMASSAADQAKSMVNAGRSGLAASAPRATAPAAAVDPTPAGRASWPPAPAQPGLEPLQGRYPPYPVYAPPVYPYR